MKRVAFSGAHDATALQVAGGKVDAGALNVSVWEKMVAEEGGPDAGACVLHHTAVLRLQLDRTRRPRSGAGEQAASGLPRSRCEEPGHAEILEAATRRQIHSDQTGELRRHRNRSAFGWPAQVISGVNHRLALDAVSHCYIEGRSAPSRNITLTVEPGEQIALIGPSGAKRTTLLHPSRWPCGPRAAALKFRVEPTLGAGRQQAPPVAQAVSSAPQHPPLPPPQRGVVPAMLATTRARWSGRRSPHCLPRRVRPTCAMRSRRSPPFALNKLWLRCDRLSGGERQRVALARAWRWLQAVNLLDEPGVLIDPVLGATALAAVQADASAPRRLADRCMT